MQEITIPYKFNPRPYQLPALEALDGGCKRVVAIWHRRSGKEKTFVNYTVKAMFERVGSYFYIFPTFTQAKKAVWDGMDKEGFPFMGHFPKEIIEKKNESDLKITTTNGSIFQLIGSENIDGIMGTNPVGVVFSEYALQDPQAWDYVRPILRENGGWAIFDFTPRGKNHGFTLYEMAKNNPDWFCQVLTVNDTGVLSQGDIDAERREGMDEDLIQQEFYCSFEGSAQGSYYAKQIQLAETEKRIGKVPYDPSLLVDTWWDLGIDDAMAIWFTQSVAREIRVIDYYEQCGEGFPHYAKVLSGALDGDDEQTMQANHRRKEYAYGEHHAPHDIAVRELGTGKSRQETAANLGIRFLTVPNIGLADGIEAARTFMSRCWFDAENCARGLDALKSYHKTYDEKRKVWSSLPYHDWSSNGADGFRYLAVGHKSVKAKIAPVGIRKFVQAGGGQGQSWMGS